MSTRLSPSGRRSPHCRTCGRPMKGHNRFECQLRSPSVETHNERSDSSDWCSTPPPYSPTPSRTPSMIFLGGRAQSAGAVLGTPHNPTLEEEDSNQSAMGSYQHRPTLSGANQQSPRRRGPRAYTPNPMTPEPSWELPGPGEVYHRINPNIEHPAYALKPTSPLQRTVSMATTEAADSDSRFDGSGSLTPTQTHTSIESGSQLNSFSSSLSRFARELEASLDSQSCDQPPIAPNGYRPRKTNLFTGPLGQRRPSIANHPIIVDTAGNPVHGFDLSALSEDLKGVLRRAEEAGFMAAVVRPRIGFQRGSINIQTNEDADRFTTVFVEGSRMDDMPIQRVNRPVKVAKLKPFQGSSFWVLVFMVVFMATVVGGYVNSNFL